MGPGWYVCGPESKEKPVGQFLYLLLIEQLCRARRAHKYLNNLLFVVGNYLFRVFCTQDAAAV